MEPFKQLESPFSLTESVFDRAIDGWQSISPETRSEHENKQSLLDLTPQVRLPSTPAREASEYLNSINNLDPVKYSPPNPSPRPAESLMSEQTLTYSSFSKLNPFHDERYTRMGDFYDYPTSQDDTMANVRPPVPPKPEYRGHKSPGMAHSQSESNINFYAPPTNAHTLRMDKNSALRGDNHTRSSGDSTDTTLSRGRTVSRTPSPVKLLEDIKEDQSPVSPISPPKRSRSPMKQLFGEGGWLGKSTSFKELPDEEYRKKGLKHWGGKIKQRVEDMTGDVSKFKPATVYQHKSPSKAPLMSKLAVSLSAPLQAKLYSEVELMVCATANQYLNVQRRQGRMSIESLAKVTQWWATKNRPQVLEFMYDQATQRDLVLYNLKTFRFYGNSANDVVAMNAMMHSWKTLAKEMSVRTFCAPDVVIKRHMHDCYKILEMLGAPLVTFWAFQEVQVKALGMMKEEQEKKEAYANTKFGVEKRWEPPVRSAEEVEELERNNPFA